MYTPQRGENQLGGRESSGSREAKTTQRLSDAEVSAEGGQRNTTMVSTPGEGPKQRGAAEFESGTGDRDQAKLSPNRMQIN